MLNLLLNVLAAQILLSGILLGSVSIFKDCILQLVGMHTHCVSTIDASLSDIAGNPRRLSQAWYDRSNVWVTNSDRGNLKLIAELLCIKHHYFSLDLFNAD